jgi:hypothetical protein
MKRLKYLYITFFFSLVLIACEEEPNFPETRLGIIPTVAVNSAMEVFDLNNRATTAVEFTLDFNNFGGELEADTIFISVASGAALNTALTFAQAVPLKYVADLPATVTVSLAEICTALGLNVLTVTNARSYELFFTVKTADGDIFREGTNLHPGVVSTNTLGYYRYRFFSGCETNIEEGYYTATISGGNRLGIGSTSEVRIAKQTIVLEGGNAYLNFLRDIFTITDLTAGFYPKSGLNPALISNQPVGVREVCGAYSLFNNALLTLPSPNPQIAFNITAGTWDASTRTLTLTWTDATNTITETTTFVKVRDL